MGLSGDVMATSQPTSTNLSLNPLVKPAGGTRASGSASTATTSGTAFIAPIRIQQPPRTRAAMVIEWRTTFFFTLRGASWFRTPPCSRDGGRCRGLGGPLDGCWYLASCQSETRARGAKQPPFMSLQQGPTLRLGHIIPHTTAACHSPGRPVMRPASLEASRSAVASKLRP